MYRIIASFAVLAGLSAAVWMVCRAALAAPPIPAAATIVADTAASSDPLASLHDGKYQFTGTLSCSAAACHGSVVPDNRASQYRTIARNEYYVWFDQDPHTRAGVTLYSARTEGILERLGWTRTHEKYQVCLDCHSPTAKVDADSTSFVSLEGVGCESCHGPAEQWRGEHYRNRSTALSHGMIDTKKLLVRGRLCADCHVGSPNREVNHDLIAAGHPMLKFELSAYMDMLPKHWNDAAERRQHQDFEVQLWAAGQIASADAALSVLEVRAKRVSENSPDAVWPEFAEYDCYACHHGLTAPSWRQTRGFAGRAPGMTPWGSWYFSMAERLGDGAELNSALTNLRAVMQASTQPDHAAISQHATAARQALATWMTSAASGDGLNVHRNDVGQLLSAIAAEKGGDEIEASDAVQNWDVATQVYLTLVALNQAHLNELEKAGKNPAAADQDLTKAIAALRDLLEFSAESDKQDGKPEWYDSPKDFTGTTGNPTDSSLPRESFRTQLLQMMPRLQERWE